MLGLSLAENLRLTRILSAVATLVSFGQHYD